ncbi:MAG: AIR synthase-related protein, partial [Chloroflexota bacterium]
AISAGLVRSCHDLAEGGLGVAAAEMALAGRLGVELGLRDLPRASDVETDTVALFSESSARFLVEVASGSERAFEEVLAGRSVARLGRVAADGVVRVLGVDGGVVIECRVKDLARRNGGGEAGTGSLWR